MDLKKIGFQLPDSIGFEEETLTDMYGKLVAEPLERGFGSTLGNALRRVLLSSIEGSAITAVKIPGAHHEFSTIKGIKEDVVDIILNIKKIRVKLYSSEKKIAMIKVKGPKVVTGEDIQSDGTFMVLNPDQVIATLSEDALLQMELNIATGRGYMPPSEIKKDPDDIGLIAVDAAFSPVRNVKLSVQSARVGQRVGYFPTPVPHCGGTW